MNQEQQDNAMSQIIAKCWADEGFKQSLLSDPTATLKAEGVELQEGQKVIAHENTSATQHIVIPAKYPELDDNDLDNISAGLSFSFKNVVCAM